MSEWIYKEEAQKIANDEIEQLNILKLPTKFLYHYTSREVFWKIMETESFLARHILFSNDYEENAIGKRKINHAMKNVGIQSNDADALPFMVCFCEKKDLLSQWRGYAQEGVALEFDFSKGLYGWKEGFSPYHCYTVMNSDAEEEPFLTKTTSSKKDTGLFMGAVVSPYAVIYTSTGPRATKNIKEAMNQIMKMPIDRRQQYANDLIPYIKNKKFDEEKEYRLIFDMKKFISESQMDILAKKYIYLDIDGVKKPNIRIKFGDMSKKQEENVISIYYELHHLEPILRNLQKELENDGIGIEIKKIDVAGTLNEEVILSDGKFQERVCMELRRLINQQTPSIEKIKIWCDGHMPIRRIIVGPSRDSELMKSSIEEYLKTKYWSRDIMVDVSDIPLRT